MKKILLTFLCLLSLICFVQKATASSCGRAAAMGDPAFCPTFKTVAYCHCHNERGMPPILCNNMSKLLTVMTTMYGSLWNACSSKVQNDVPQQECVDNWNYYSAHCQ